MKKEIKLDMFEPRWYQKELFDAIENKDYKKVLLCWCRRTGKDLSCWNLMIRQTLKRIGSYFYIWPTYAQGKKAFWDGRTIAGIPFLDYLPPDIIKSKNSTEMKIELLNRSVIQVVGSENYDRIRGSNPVGVIFSEFAYSDPNAFTILRPVLLANKGWCIVESTPHGENFFYSMYKSVKKSKSWYVSFLTIDDTKHIPISDIEEDIKEGRMSRDMALQEYWNSFTAVTKGSIFAEYIKEMVDQGRTKGVMWDRNKRVYTAWDLGINDAEVILFFQLEGNSIYIIDFIEGHNMGTAYYAKVLSQKPYHYGGHIAPHDIEVREHSVVSEISGNALTRKEVAASLGLNFEVAPKMSYKESEEALKRALSRMYIKQENCERVISALRNHYRKYETKTETYRKDPVKDWTEHFVSAMRYLVTGLHKVVEDGTSSKDLEELYKEAITDNMYYR